MIPKLDTDRDNLKDLSDSDLQNKYYYYLNLIELLDEKKLCFGDEGESNIKTNFSKIKIECESRFHVSKFPLL